MRAFVAIEPSEAARRAAALVADALRARADGSAVRWMRAETLHLTLRFLGDVQREKITPLALGLLRAAEPVAPFELRLGPVEAIPSSRRPRVIALGVMPTEPVEALAARVESCVVAQGFEAEARPFRPHLTLGRVRGRFALVDEPSPRPSPFEVREIVLFASDLLPDGARHTPLERIPLGGENHPETRVFGGA